MSPVSANRVDDPRGRQTRALLIECAEAMVAEFGVNGVSVRQIAKMCGSSNSSVVAYHFGDKSSLLKAILEHRLPAIEARRKVLLSGMLRGTETPAVRALVDALYRPFFEQRDVQGRRSYAAFVAELVRANLIDIRTSLNSDYPVTAAILDEIRKRAGDMPLEPFGQRIFLSSAVIFAALRQIDQISPDEGAERRLFEDAITAATAVIEAQNRPDQHVV
jgi:AcrR family transcriptional regulator